MPPIDLSAIIPLAVFGKIFAIANVAGGGLMAYDKFAARFDLDRISEEDLGKVALVGGFLGVTIVGLLLRHKVSKPVFWVSVVLGGLVWITFFVIYFDPSILTHLVTRLVAA